MYVFCVYVRASVRVCFCEYTKIKFSRFFLEIFLSTKCFTFLLSQKKTTAIESQILIMLNMKTLDTRSQSPCIFFQYFNFVKSVRIWSFSGPHFSAFGLNTDRNEVSLHIQSGYWKIETKETPNTSTFHTVSTLLKTIVTIALSSWPF